MNEQKQHSLTLAISHQFNKHTERALLRQNTIFTQYVHDKTIEITNKPSVSEKKNIISKYFEVVEEDSKLTCKHKYKYVKKKCKNVKFSFFVFS